MSRIFRNMFLSEKTFLFSVPKVEFEPPVIFPFFKELSNPWDHQIIVMDRKKVLLENHGDDGGIPRDLGKLHTVIKQQGVNSMKLPGPVNVYKKLWKITMRIMGKSTISTGPFSIVCLPGRVPANSNIKNPHFVVFLEISQHRHGTHR